MTKEMDENVKKLYSRVGNFKGFQFNGKAFFYIHTYNEKQGSKDVICSEQGNILFAIKDLGDYGFINISSDKSYIYTINEKEFIIKSFRWNKKFADLLINAE
ncbi:MAG: hypothetical protein C0412_17755 [Flavobacterium sp.]|nr:hypothetical protein [Flavobacterium sp.]